MELAHVKIKSTRPPITEELSINGQNFANCTKSATINLVAGDVPTIKLELYIESLELDGEYQVLNSAMVQKNPHKTKE